MSVSLCLSCRATDGESDGGRDGGGGVMGIRLFSGWVDTTGGSEVMGGNALPFFPSNVIWGLLASPDSLPTLNSGSCSFSELQSLRSVISRSESDSGSCFTPPLLSVGLCWSFPFPAPTPTAPNPSPRTGGLGSPRSLSPSDAPFPMSVRSRGRLPG